MSRRGILLTVLLAGVILIYGYMFGGWFTEEVLLIQPQIRAGRPSRIERDPTIPPVHPVAFLLSRKYGLKSVKVVAADDLATNKYPYALWHLVSDTQSAPTKSIVYGTDLPKMKPAIPRRQADPLMPRVKYVIQIQTASGISGQTNFTAREIVRR